MLLLSLGCLWYAIQSDYIAERNPVVDTYVVIVRDCKTLVPFLSSPLCSVINYLLFKHLQYFMLVIIRIALVTVVIIIDMVLNIIIIIIIILFTSSLSTSRHLLHHRHPLHVVIIHFTSSSASSSLSLSCSS